VANEEPSLKTLVGYCEPWSLRAGEQVTLFASADQPESAQLDLVRIDCGDPTSAGPGFAEEVVAAPLPGTVSLTTQPITPGSYAVVDLEGVVARERTRIDVSVLATRPEEPQTIAWFETTKGEMAFVIENRRLCVKVGPHVVPLRSAPLAERRWYRLTVDVDLATGQFVAEVSTAPSASPGRDLLEPPTETVTMDLPPATREFQQLVLGGGPQGGNFDGRLGGVSFLADDTLLTWDFSKDMHTRRVVDTSGNDRHGTLHQLPARGVTGPTWDSTHQRWTDDPSQWDACHFHKDDLYDCGWEATATLDVPVDLPSGIYAFRVTVGDEIDRVPFFVRPAEGAPTAAVAMLMSSATYMAYANHRQLFEGADFIPARSRLRPEHDYVRRNDAVGRSMYESHPDGSGVMFSSRRRPVLHVRPGADGWNFTPDTDLNAFLVNEQIGHDIISDEDVHYEGLAALAPYRVIVTGSHPEYWSTAMLDALDQWQRNGGRLMYLGGNGFYWRVAFSDDWPGAIELRRAEDGVRNWQTENGENYHAFTGEYGGMWRRNNRAPNELVGIGFAAQGFGRATHYDVNEDSLTSRAAWIWQGVTTDDGRIGTSGLGGGAAGQELDRYDTNLGSPPHAVVLASATDFGPDMVRTKEEFAGSVTYPTPDPYVRADIVFYETPAGGAVFSVGSISWFGALARNGYDNDIATMTSNVLKRFADPAPFEVPDNPPLNRTDLP